MSALRRVALLALVLCLVTAAPTAHADSNADEAEARFQRGATLYRQGRYDEALLEFFQSNRLVPNRNVVFNIARTYEALQRYDEAYRYYDEYLAGETDDGERAATEKRLRDLSPRVALVRVTSDPPGATVYVDRRDLGGRGATPLTLALPAGAHVVFVELEGFEARQADVKLVRGQTVEATVGLPAIVGTVTIRSTPVAEVRVDRDDQDVAAPDAKTTPATLRLAPGRHSIELRAAGYRPRRREVIVAPNGATALDVDLEEIPPPSGTVVVQASVREAQVVVDGAVHGFSPAVMTLVVGRHRVEVRRVGYTTWQTEVDVTEGSRQFVQAPLRRAEAEVVGATRTAQAASDAPASVSLVSRGELDAFGYETLADALRGVRGLYDSDDRNYHAVGIRGFSRPGDYTNRVLVLRDGHVVNDDWIGQGNTGRDFAPDLDDVERIEIVRGPGSAFYGPGAFFGVVNVVSRDAGVGPTVHAGLGATSDGGTRATARGSTQIADGKIRVSLQASAQRSAGQTLEFDEFAGAGSGGFVSGADGEEAQHAAARVLYGDFALDARWNRRDKQLPTASYGTVFDPARFDATGNVVTGTLDERTFVEARWERRVGTARLRARVNWDRAEYSGRWPYDDPGGAFLLRDAALSQWYGGEAQVALDAPGGQRLTIGVEAAGHDVSQSVDEDSDGMNEFDDHREFITGSAYLVDEVSLGSRVRLTGGLRVDRSGAESTGSLSPRLAAVVTPYTRGRTKIIVGRAFRAPSVYELYYQDNSVTQKPAGPLGPETIWTAEIEHAHELGDRSHVTASLFGNRIEGLIGLEEDPADMLLVFENSGDVVWSAGAEIEARRTWESGAFVSGAASLAHLDADNAVRANSAPLTGALRAFWPAGSDALGLAAELIYNAPRPDREGGLDASDFALLANVIASGRVADDRIRFRVGIYNLLDWQWSVPVGEEFVQLGIRQPGRTFTVQLSYDY